MTKTLYTKPVLDVLYPEPAFFVHIDLHCFAKHVKSQCIAHSLRKYVGIYIISIYISKPYIDLIQAICVLPSSVSSCIDKITKLVLIG